MKKSLFTAFAAVALGVSSCGEEESMDKNLHSFTDLESLLVNDDFIEQLNEMRPADWGDPVHSLTNQAPQSRNDLEKMRTVVKMYNGSNNAGLSVPGFGGIKLGKDEVNLNVYYLETKVITNGNDSTVYGCGYSVHYLFKKVERGIDVSNLPTVAASAQLNSKKTQVYYSLQSYGIIGQNLVKYFKPTVNKNFNVEGFGIMQSSIEGIHNVLGDSVLSNSVKFTPEIIKFVRPYELEQL